MVSRFISIIVVVMATLTCSNGSLFNGQPQFTIKADKNKAFDQTCIIKTFTIKYGNIADCLEHCLEDCRCQSFQICQNTECQLCSSHKEENSSLLHDKHDCLYVTYEMKNSIQPSQNVKYAGLDCLRKYNCCQVSDICPERKICKTTRRFDKPWKRFTCECPDGYHGNSCSEPMSSSCAGYANGNRQPGLYKVVDTAGKVYEAYCHFDVYGAWTLVLSYSFSNRNMEQFKQPLFEDRPLSENTHTWSGYRLRKSRMENIEESSKLFRFTCDHKKNQDVQNPDFLQASLVGINIFQDTFTSLHPPSYTGKIGGINFPPCNVMLAQSQASIFHAYISPESTTCLSKYIASSNLHCHDAIADSEPIPIFGGYDNYKCRYEKHVCTQNENSTTQMWLGEA